VGFVDVRWIGVSIEKFDQTSSACGYGKASRVEERHEEIDPESTVGARGDVVEDSR
jgi:hypothetical protein